MSETRLVMNNQMGCVNIRSRDPTFVIVSSMSAKTMRSRGQKEKHLLVANIKQEAQEELSIIYSTFLLQITPVAL